MAAPDLAAPLQVLVADELTRQLIVAVRVDAGPGHSALVLGAAVRAAADLGDDDRFAGREMPRKPRAVVVPVASCR